MQKPLIQLSPSPVLTLACDEEITWKIVFDDEFYPIWRIGEEPDFVVSSTYFSLLFTSIFTIGVSFIWLTKGHAKSNGIYFL